MPCRRRFAVMSDRYGFRAAVYACITATWPGCRRRLPAGRPLEAKRGVSGESVREVRSRRGATARRRVAVLASLIFALQPAAQAADDQYLHVTLDPDQTIRQVAEKYLSDPDLWPDILRASGIQFDRRSPPGHGAPHPGHRRLGRQQGARRVARPDPEGQPGRRADLRPRRDRPRRRPARAGAAEAAGTRVARRRRSSPSPPSTSRDDRDREGGSQARPGRRGAGLRPHRHWSRASGRRTSRGATSRSGRS